MAGSQPKMYYKERELIFYHEVLPIFHACLHARDRHPRRVQDRAWLLMRLAFEPYFVFAQAK